MSNDLKTLRGTLLQDRDAALQSQKRLADARARLALVRNTGLGDPEEAQRELERASALADAARLDLQARQQALKAALGAAVGQFSEAPADVPVALLPVGLETRFVGDTLLVRIIPDQIHVEDHETALSDAEVEAGRGFWRSVWRAGTAEPAATEDERKAWAALASAIGSSRRASWVADQTAPRSARPAAPTAPDQALPEPDFPEPARRPGAWSQPAVARSLPDQFVAIAYRRSGSGGTVTWTEIGRATGQPVDDSVQLGLDPAAPPTTVDDDGPALPEGMRWLVNAEAAEQAGLLLRLALPAGTEGVDRLVVLGVLGSLDTAAAAARLADLLVGHHHSSGLEVLRVGTATNNTAADTSGYAGRSDLQASFEVERRTPAPPEGSDGALLTRALGVPADTLRGVANSNDAEQAAAGQINALVWPAAMGYWLDSLVQPGPTDAQTADIRRHAVQMVRGRGPLPPLRIGRQPYGVLPVTSLKAWQPLHEPAAVVRVVDFMRRVLPWWLEGVDHAPVVRAGADPGQGLLDALGQLPVSRSVGVRSMIGKNASYLPQSLMLAGLAGQALADEADRQRWMSLMGLKALGVNDVVYLAHLVAAPDPTATLRLPYVVDERLPPDQQAAAWQAVVAYLKALRVRLTEDFKAEDPHRLTSLLGLIARRSVMLERLRAAVMDTQGTVAGRLVEAHVRVDAPPVVAAALIPTTATLRIGQSLSTAGEVMAGSVRRTDGTLLRMSDHLDARFVNGPAVLDVLRNADYLDTLHAAEFAATLTPDRAALLLGEALDVASHRLDAWITSLATRRLSDLRTAAPSGITLGAWGAVEDLVRRPARQAVDEPPAGAPLPLFTDGHGGGYIHAPSLAQAATAAVLRAGHLAHADRDAGSAALAIDLSSARVRAALGLLDGVRQGQSLGALLGYRAERDLHERGAHTAVEAVRRLAPPPVVTATGTPEGLPPRAVCDGLALSRLKREDVLAATQAVGADDAVVAAVLDALGDAVDAVADLLLAESVHQVVKGNPERSAAALDTLNRGEGAVVEPEVVRTPRTGTGLTQRVLIAIGPNAPAAPGWPTDGIRARAEPLVEVWAGHLLGDPSGLMLSLRAGGVEVVSFPLADLGLGALDLVYEPLVPRALRHARRLVGRDGVTAGAAFDLQAPPLAALMARAAQVRELLTRTRTGTGLDLMRPQDRGRVIIGPPPVAGTAAAAQSATPLVDVDQGQRAARLQAARERLLAARDALPVLSADAEPPAEVAVADALDVLASFGIAPGGDPTRPPDTAALIAMRAAASAQIAKAEAAPDDAAALFGEGFPVLALAAAPFPAVVNAALAADPVGAAPVEVLEPLGGAAQALDSWLETTGRVRVPVGRLADVLLAARLQGAAPAARLRALQLPLEPFPTAAAPQRGQWVGLKFPAPLGAEPVTSLVLHALGSLDAKEGMGLLVVDEYTEAVPGDTTTTAIAFGYDAPGARPPQSVLLAVPPVAGQAWSIDLLASVIGETLDLARVRMVDLSSVAWAGRLLPTLYLTDGDIGSGFDLPMKSIVAQAHQIHQAFKP